MAGMMGNYANSSLNPGGSGLSSGTARRVSKLGATAGSSSKKERSCRLLLQSAEPKIINCALVSALLVFGLGIYNNSVFFSISSSEGWKQSLGTKQSMAWAANGSIHGRVLEAHTDLTTKDLYDDIKFKDEEGGIWRQGWNVQYRGHEWDEEPFKVFVVPHLHNDPGWLRTIEEYYRERSRSIISTIVESLKKDKRRKFIWEEISFLERWWQDASTTDREDFKRWDFKRWVKTGQLEIVGGG